jgi:mannose-6-phosphate isomerase-like protein (cupin superfamily)
MKLFKRSNTALGGHDGFTTWLLVGASNSTAKEVSLQLTHVDVGVQHPVHSHVEEQVYFILLGRGSLRVGDEETAVAQGDAVFIPSNALHGIRNTGDTDLEYVTCNSPFSLEKERLLWPKPPSQNL